MEKNNPEHIEISVKQRVMKEIREKKIKMRSPMVFVAEKLGLESAVASAIIVGALLVSLVFYIFVKTGLVKFLSLGMSGFKVFILALPYGHMALFVAAIILAVYFANKSQIFCGNCEHTNTFAMFFFPLAIILGIIFFTLGVGSFFSGWKNISMPDDMAVRGKIKSYSEKQVIIEDEEGSLIKIFWEDEEIIPQDGWYGEGKFLWAVGQRDKKDSSSFHAERMHCCEDK